MRKKKALWLLIIFALAALGWKLGWLATALVAGLLAAALAMLFCGQWLLAGMGMGRLRPLRAKYGLDLMAADLIRREGDADTFRFVVLGDTRNMVRVAREVYERASDEQPAMIFHTGDIVRHGSPAELLRNHVALLSITDPTPMFCVPGNHERGVRRDFAAFRALYGDDRFSFDFGGCRFVGFNNCTKGRGSVRDDDLAWLDRELGKPGVRHRYVFMHIPPAFFEATFVSDTRRRGFTRNAEAFHALMQKHGVDEVFMAHIHGYASTVIDGVRYTLTAGGGAPLSGRLAKEGQAYNYVVLRVTPTAVRRTVVRGRGEDWSREEEG
jgi:3',5'-cyclic AMP phosphodiesterase CpdA